MNRSGEVTGYNAFESARSGLRVERVMGRNFFVEVGPCTNNYLIAQRFADCEELDEQLDYVFTFRMAPTPVRLRLLARAGSLRQYLAVRFR
jgi:photoactive yellow protein